MILCTPQAWELLDGFLLLLPITLIRQYRCLAIEKTLLLSCCLPSHTCFYSIAVLFASTKIAFPFPWRLQIKIAHFEHLLYLVAVPSSSSASYHSSLDTLWRGYHNPPFPMSKQRLRKVSSLARDHNQIVAKPGLTPRPQLQGLSTSALLAFQTQNPC